MIKIEKIKHFLRHPLTILGAIVGGVLLGLYQKEFSMEFSFIGTLYMTVLQMSVIPLVFVLVTTGVSNLFSMKEETRSSFRFIRVSCLSLLLVSGIGILAAWAFKPGEYSTPEVYERIMNIKEVDLSRVIALTDPIEPVLTDTVKNFVLQLFPENIFHAFSEGKTLQLVVFALIFGTALGLLPKKNGEKFKDILRVTQLAFQKIIAFVISLFPIGIIFITSSQISHLSFDIVSLLLRFIFFSLAGFGLLFVASSLILWKSSGTSFWKSLYAMNEPIILSLTTRNTLISMPSAIESLVKGLHFDRKRIEFSLPLSISFLRFGNILYFSFLTIMIMQLYQVPAGLFEYSFTLVGAIIAGIATAGTSGIATLGLLGIVVEPLGLPVGAALIFLTLIDPLIDPFRTLVGLHTNAALVSYLDRKK